MLESSRQGIKNNIDTNTTKNVFESQRGNVTKMSTHSEHQQWDEKSYR